jgi:hypothetical protein
VKFRVVCARTREPLGEFEATDQKDAAEKGKKYEDKTRHTIVYPVPEEATPVEAVKANLPIEENGHVQVGVDMALGEDKTVVVTPHPFRTIEQRLEKWLSNPVSIGLMSLPEGYSLVPHIDKEGGDCRRGEWPVTFTLVHRWPEKRGSGNGSSQRSPERSGSEDAD